MLRQHEISTKSKFNVNNTQMKHTHSIKKKHLKVAARHRIIFVSESPFHSFLARNSRINTGIPNAAN